MHCPPEENAKVDEKIRERIADMKNSTTQTISAEQLQREASKTDGVDTLDGRTQNKKNSFTF